MVRNAQVQVNVLALVLVLVGDAKLQVGVGLGNGSFSNVSTPGRVVSTDEGSGGSVAKASAAAVVPMILLFSG